jgi:hypothetical protein
VTSTRLPMHGRNHRPKGWNGPSDPGGSDPLNWLSRVLGGPRLDESILERAPMGFWKLNELSGSTAYDSSGNDYHLTVPAGASAPGWGQIPGPPGDPSALFEHATNRALSGSFPEITGPLTAILWMNRTTTEGGVLVGQGQPFRSSPGGWGFYVDSSSGSNKVQAGRFPSGSYAESDAILATGAWVMLAATRDSSNVWRLYRNGLLQTTTGTSAGSTSGIWIGSDSYCGHPPEVTCNNLYAPGILSYVAVWSRELSGADIFAINEGAVFDTRTINTNYTIDPSTDRLIFATGTITVTLPTAVGRPGAGYTVKNVGSGTVAVTAPGTEKMEGAGTPGSATLTAGVARQFTSDGVGWRITGGYL